MKDSSAGYGIVSRCLHWVSAIIVIGLFASGLYMVDLSYYDKLYHTLPFYHKSIGIVFMLIILLRIVWRMVNPKPAPLKSVNKWEHIVANIVQFSMMLLMVVVVILGYLISTAAGDGVSVFDWFHVPAVISGLDNQADFAGKWHYYGACALIALAVLHALAALKHHFIDKDRTLLRMVKGK